ncbi:hypothetical protein G6F37_003421 [Rhizopus arrhizus]|nr:hypothetical protein G6F38_006967 [Rhizopus arrhizus]KAG1161052.1 hypothetical protein G6F37_003421 [Rhizopus arrhizus]
MNEKNTLWMGDLEHWMDEVFLRHVWQYVGEEVVVKVIRNKKTGTSCGYAFIEFSSNQAAQRALFAVHGIKIPFTESNMFRLNWASGGGICDKKENRIPEFSIFVGDLNNDVDEHYLLALFRTKYSSCHSVKIMTNSSTGLSRGYGFVRFSDQQEQQQAVIEMNGILCKNRPMRVSFATPKTNNQERYIQLALQAPALVQQPTDPNNTTVFIGGLSSPVTEDELKQYFGSFGDIMNVKLPPGKGCGFVQYTTRISAETAIEKMNGFLIGTSRIRLSWGRSSNHQSDTMNSKQMANNDFFGTFRPLSPPYSLYNNSSGLFSPKHDWLSMDYYEDRWPL